MNKQKVSTFIRQLCAEWNRPDSTGVSVAIISEGELIFAHGVGSANLEHQIPITPETIFDIGSASKQFTAFAIAMLIGDKQIAMDDNIRDYLPDIPDLGYPITVRHLIHHTSGLRNHSPLLRFAQTDYTIQDVRRLVQYQTQFEFRPGDQFEYNNTGYGLLAALVEQITEQPFSSWTKSHIFDPLHMKNTLVNDDYTQIIRNVAQGYSPDHANGYKKDMQASPVGPGGVFSNVLDLTRWIENLGSGKVGGPQVLDQIQEQGVLNNGETLPYAFGLFTGKIHDIPMIEHGGEARGFRSAISYLPTKKTGVVILANSSDCDVWGLVRNIYDGVVFNRQPSVSPPPENDSTPLTAHPDPQIYDAYDGKYLIEPGHIVAITKEHDRLYWKLPGGPRFELTPTSDTEFLDQDGDPVAFLRERSGACSQMSLIWDGKETLAQRLPKYDERDLACYTGQYYCQDVDQVFTIALSTNQLVAKNLEHGEIVLEPCENDQFGADPWWFRQIDFIRKQKTISGFHMTAFGFRAKSRLTFQKIHVED